MRGTGAVPLNSFPAKSNRMNTVLNTDRLVLRPLRAGDAARVRALCGNWNIARMLARVPHPYPEGLAEEWIGAQAALWAKGESYIFAVTLDGDVIGVIGLEGEDDGTYELGYWLGEPWWGHGYMSEAVARVLDFAFDDLKLPRVIAGYFADNPASGRIQDKFGFRMIRQGTLECRARGQAAPAIFTELRAGARP